MSKNEQLRETVGRAAHQAMVRYFKGKSSILTQSDWTWEELDEDTRELYRCEADGVLEALKQAQAIKEKHDGRLDSSVDGDFDARIWLDRRYIRIEYLNYHVVLDAKQALSLLAWLEQERFTLEQLAKEQ